MEQLNARIVLRNDSHANWEANSTEVLLKGEVGIEFFDDGTAKIKIGDGVNTWADLDYFGGEGGTAVIAADNASIVVENGAIAISGFSAATAGQVPRVSETGTIEWYTPITVDNVDVITEQLESLSETVTNHTTTIEALQTSKANTTDVYTKAEVDALVNGAIIKDVVASVDELQNVQDPEVGDRVQVLGDQIYVYNGTDWEPFSLCTIDIIKLAGTALDIVDKSVDIPAASADSYGVVKLNAATNGVTSNTDGALEVSAVSVDKLVNAEDTVLVLNGGTASTETI